MLLALGWFLLPDRVPIHFGAGGEADRWVGRSRAVLEMGAVMVGMTLLFTGLAALVGRMSPTLLNLPYEWKQWWAAEPARLARLRGMLAEDVLVIGALTLALIGWMLLLTGLAAHQEDPALGWAPWVLLAAYLTALGVLVIRMAVGRYRPRE